VLAIALDRLAVLGRQGPRALAVIVVIGIAVPPLGTLLRPWLPEAVFLLLTLAFLRMDVSALRRHLRRRGLILVATLWSAFGVPLLFAIALELAGLRAQSPGLFLGLMLQGLASPMMAAPALAALIGLDATLVLITLVTGTVVLPVSAPLLAQLLLGSILAVPPAVLGMRLGIILVGSLLLALILRRCIGTAAIERHGDAVGGVNILVLLVFVSAVMKDVALVTRTDPVAVAGLVGLAFLVFGALLLGTALLFRRAGRTTALSLGIMASQRNMGLMVAAADGALPEATWLYFSLCQFPIYLSPLLLRPLFGRMGIPSVG
jgi:hypothetical protein